MVECDEDYVRACWQMSAKEVSTSGLNVWVRSKNHFAWLRDFAEQIGCPAFFSEKNPRLVLAEKWNVVLPDWLTDAQVLDQDLLQIDVKPQDQQTSFSSRLLVHFLGSAFEPDHFNMNDLADVIKALVSADAKTAFKRYPVVHRALKSKCQRWTQSSKEVWMKNLLLFGILKIQDS